MDKIDKQIFKNFQSILIPQQFLNTSDKLLFNEFFAGKFVTFLEKNIIDKESMKKIITLKNKLYNDIDLSNNDNLIYFNYFNLIISILNKYSQ